MVGGDVRDVPAVDDDPPGIRLVEAGQRAQRGRLAAARRAEQRDQLARGDLERQPVEGVDRAVVAVQVEELDGDAGALRATALASRGRCRIRRLLERFLAPVGGAAGPTTRDADR